MTKLLVKYATRGRPAWFMNTMTNILTTIGPCDFEIMVTADSNDETMSTKEIRHFIDVCRNTRIIFGESKSKVDAINRDMDQAGKWDILINMSDDMQWIAYGWGQKIIDRCKEVWGDSLDFFAHFNDGFTHEGLTTMSIIGRDYYKRDGYIYHPHYRSFSCDAEAMYVAQMRKRYHYFPEILFHHQHPTNMPKNRTDETYRINSMHSDHDTLVYWHRMKNYFGEPIYPDTPIPYHMHMHTAKKKAAGAYPEC